VEGQEEKVRGGRRRGDNKQSKENMVPYVHVRGEFVLESMEWGGMVGVGDKRKIWGGGGGESKKWKENMIPNNHIRENLCWQVCEGWGRGGGAGRVGGRKNGGEGCFEGECGP
jgi:hypothetical protein